MITSQLCTVIFSNLFINNYYITFIFILLCIGTSVKLIGTVTINPLVQVDFFFAQCF